MPKKGVAKRQKSSPETGVSANSGFMSNAVDVFFSFLRHPAQLSLIILFEVLLALSLFIANSASSWLIQRTASSYNPLLNNSIIFGYAFMMILIYSFFTFCILDFIRSLFRKEQFRFNAFPLYAGLNIVIILPFILIYMAILMFSYNFIRPELIGIFGLIILLPIVFFTYPLLSWSQVISFSGNKGFLNSLAESFFQLKKGFLSYSLLYILDVVVVSAYGLFFFALTYLLNLLFFKNDALNPIYQAYQTGFIWLTFSLLILLLVYNKAFFFSVYGVNNVH